jgi:hypothetical protein
MTGRGQFVLMKIKAIKEVGRLPSSPSKGYYALWAG